ncbi:lipase family protein [Methylicorpusculum oleiharenae]|uniref:lipase family protein n=1 Tax=Methylicorpusculum oleiharenae TaxID=1338687 RepID=UPI001356F50F|nr:lipase family protein [Methylicorpusculum oleiharenae]MCD2453457.1 lipase family protein [Methylicorpusculum oleiharenae]
MSISFDPRSTQFSLNNAHALAFCSNLAYESEKTIEDKLKQHGFSTTFIERRDTQAFIAYNDTAIVLSFRGTTNIQDWMLNSDLLLASVRAGTGKVHSGFLRALCLVWDDILQVIADVQNNAQPLWISGHSLGGALATLAAARFSLELDKPVRGIYTFGQPRVGDREFARVFNAELKQIFFRIVNNSDIVTRIPTRVPMGYSHVGSLRFFDSNGTLFDDVSLWQEFLETIKGNLKQQLDLIPSNIENHKMERYIQNIESQLQG